MHFICFRAIVKMESVHTEATCGFSIRVFFPLMHLILHDWLSCATWICERCGRSIGRRTCHIRRYMSLRPSHATFVHVSSFDLIFVRVWGRFLSAAAQCEEQLLPILPTVRLVMHGGNGK